MLASVRTGLLGGTFDPPHIAHLLAGEVAYRQLGLDRVLFIPAGSPWQKAGKVVSLPDRRWRMTELATEGIEYFEADNREVDRDGLTYTVDTLATFPADEDLWLILGADAARGLPTWERFPDVMSRARVAVLPRPGIDPQEVDDAIGPNLWLDMAPVAISGTLIRQRVQSGVGYRFMVTEPVYDYIEAQLLYRADSA
jgi:nicotinate-nucleotide adenylyltransferase